MNKSPAFQLYASDFLVDTLEWDIEEVGIYTRLLYAQWANGDLPDDGERLSRIAGCSLKKFIKSSEKVMEKFIKKDDGRIINLRLEETRIRQEEFRSNAIESGRKGGLRSQKGRRVTTSNPSSNPSSNQPSENEALQSSSSTSIKTISKQKVIFEDGKFKNIPPAIMEKWRQVAPGINVPAEIAKAELWVISNPDKVRSRWAAFLSRWIVKAQDNFVKYGGNGNGKSTAIYRTDIRGQKVPDEQANEVQRLNEQWEAVKKARRDASRGNAVDNDAPDFQDSGSGRLPGIQDHHGTPESVPEEVGFSGVG
jgi:uncharacterized protein YdaU (DUF1376 family)